jgi:uncharacterized membrane protein YkvI
MRVLNYLLVFVATVAVDYAWTRYIAEAAAKRPTHAALWSAAIIACGGFNVVAYTADHWLLIPAILGAFVGTWFAVWKDQKKT